MINTAARAGEDSRNLFERFKESPSTQKNTRQKPPKRHYFVYLTVLLFSMLFGAGLFSYLLGMSPIEIKTGIGNIKIGQPKNQISNFFSNVTDIIEEKETQESPELIKENLATSDDLDEVLQRIEEIEALTSDSFFAGTGLKISNVGGITYSHAKTTTLSSINEADGTVIQDIGLDQFGHVTGSGTVNLDDRFYKQTYADNKFFRKEGDTISGILTFSAATTNITTIKNQHLVISPNGSGNIGIGISNPTVMFDVFGSGKFSALLSVGTGITSPKITLTSGATQGYLLQSDSSGNATWASLVAGTGIGITNNSGTITINNTSSGVGTSYSAGNGLTLSGTEFKLGGTLSEITGINQGGYDFGFQGTGNVGIGTTAPTAGYKLDINGNLKVGSTAYFGSYVGIGATSPNQMLHLYTSSTSPAIELSNDGGAQGANNPSLGETIAGANKAWLNPERIVAEDGSAALGSPLSSGSNVFNYLRATGFNFNLPDDAVILGIKVEIKKRKVGTGVTGNDTSVEIVKGGVGQGDNKASGTNWPTTLTYSTYGGSTDLWGVSWTPSDINASNFGAEISATALCDGACTALNVDHVRITVYYRQNWTIGNNYNGGGIFQISRSGVVGTNPALTIDKVGNVGIGYTSPGNKLVVSGGVGIGTTAASSIYFSSPAPDGGLLVEGNVGIGTTLPTSGYKFDVVGNLRVGGSANITSTLTLGSLLYANNGVGTSGQVLMSNAGTRGPEWTTISSSNTYTFSNGLTLTGSDVHLGGTLSELTQIGMNGNNIGLWGTGSFGIGTTSPTEKLSLAGGNFLHSASGNPTLEGSYNTSGDARGVYVSEKYAYVADEASGLILLDISNPASIAVGGTYNTSGTANDVYVSGKYAYVADGTSGLQIIDISNPFSPSLTGTYDTGGTAWGVYISGKYAYVADYDAGLQIIDVSNPASPSLTGTYNTTGSSIDVYVSGKYAFVADGASGLQIIDVSNPASPSLTGTFSTISSIEAVYISGKYAYVADVGLGLYIVNINNPALPSSTGSYYFTNSQGVYVSGKYAYVADGAFGMRVVDISNPASPSLTGTYDTSGVASDVHVSGKYVYTADGAGGLQIVDINGMETPSLYAGNIQTNDISVTENLDIGNNLYIRNGLNVGPGGILSNGFLSINNINLGATSPLALFQTGSVGAGSTGAFVQITSYGNVGIGMTPSASKFAINQLGAGTGNNLAIDASGNVFQVTSSLRYKEDVLDLSDDWEKILSAEPKSFKYKNTGQSDIGFIAEEFDSLGLKNLVGYDQDGRPQSIKYDRISLYLLEVIKKQQEKINSLSSDFSNFIASGSKESSAVDTLTASQSALLQNVGIGLEGETATLSALLVTGNANIAELGITGKITNGVLTINGMSDSAGTLGADISTLSGPLRLQANALGNLEIMSGKVQIDTQGNLIVQGTLTVKKINIDETDVLSASSGEGTIKTNETETLIETKSASESSRIFVTAKDAAIALGIKEQKEGSFKVILEKILDHDLKFSWWVIN